MQYHFIQTELFKFLLALKAGKKTRQQHQLTKISKGDPKIELNQFPVWNPIGKLDHHSFSGVNVSLKDTPLEILSIHTHVDQKWNWYHYWEGKLEAAGSGGQIGSFNVSIKFN